MFKKLQFWFRRWRCRIQDHQQPVITGRHICRHGDWIVMSCYYCCTEWMVPIPKNQTTVQL